MSAALASAAPLALVFLASAFVMVIEITAGRLVARHVGSSLHTWTSIIAVVLAGLSLGNVLGGWVADRTPTSAVRGRVAGLLSASALVSLTILWLHGWIFTAVAAWGWPWPMQILTGVTVTFLAPSIALGMISPVVATWALAIGSSVGRTVGAVYAWGSVGAIVGTLLTGFVLVAAFGTTVVIGVVALALATLALAVRPGRRELGALAAVVVGLALAAGSVPLAWLSSLQPIDRAVSADTVFATESRYQSIIVRELASGVRLVVIDDLIHGYVHPDDPGHLEYAYLQVFAALDMASRPGAGAAATLHLGGGAYTFPRFLAARWPADQIVVAEIDPEVTAANQRATWLADPLPFSVHHADARRVVSDLSRAGARFDAVYGDAFHGMAVPYHLATQEFVAAVDSILAPSGFFAVNVIDVLASGRLLGAFVETVRSVFPYASVIATHPLIDDGGRDTYVVVGSRAPIDLAAVRVLAGAEGWAFHPFDAAGMRTLRARSRGLVLTDEFVPVDTLVSLGSRGR